MKRIEFGRFATSAILLAQFLSGLLGIVLVISGIRDWFSDFLNQFVGGLGLIVHGLILFGAFFAFGRVVNLSGDHSSKS